MTRSEAVPFAGRGAGHERRQGDGESARTPRTPSPAPSRGWPGAPRSRDARLSWWQHRQESAADKYPADQPVRMTVRDVLDYFEKCPDCGYPAQASATVREMAGGRVETVIQASCGLPCGWQGKPEVSGSETAESARPDQD